MGMTNSVQVGRDGWLFLSGGANDPGAYMRGDRQFERRLVDGWCERLLARESALSGIPYVHLIAPNKETVYYEEAGYGADDAETGPLGSLFAQAPAVIRGALRKLVIDPRSYFARLKPKRLLYWKTDSHWTPWGCYAAYQLICAKLDVEPRRDLFRRPFAEVVRAMDLGQKVSPPMTETVRFYRFAQEARRVSANEIVQFKEQTQRQNDVGLHVGSSVVFQNPSPTDGRRVLLFGDSFSEYRTGLLTGMLAETFREVHFVWSTQVDFDYVRDHAPDIVLSEIVERFMPRVPDDRLAIAEYVAAKMKEVEG